ncbi:hypothetical protein AABB24_000603, partial [Solanum stoloniferum]
PNPNIFHSSSPLYPAAAALLSPFLHRRRQDGDTPSPSPVKPPFLLSSPRCLLFPFLSSSCFPVRTTPPAGEVASSSSRNQQQQLLRPAASAPSFPLISLRLSFLSPFLFSFLSSLRRNTTSSSRRATPAAGSTPTGINSSSGESFSASSDDNSSDSDQAKLWSANSGEVKVGSTRDLKG